MSFTGADLHKRRRHLPHWEMGGSTYFLTFRSLRGLLPDPALPLINQHILHDHGRRYELFFAVIMPDHVHLILRPLERSPGQWYSLSEINRTLKGASARSINRLLHTTGAVWQEETFDRIIRDEKEYQEKLNYMWENPWKAGLVENPDDYPHLVYPPPLPE